MRGYPRGTAWAIAPRLNVKGARVGARFRRPVLVGVPEPDEPHPSLAFEQRLPELPAGAAVYRGKTVMLIDDRAISQAEHTGLFFEAAAGTVFIGTPTAGANGDVTSLLLPGGLTVWFTGHDVRHADGRPLQRVGLQPTIRVEPTVAGLRAGRDEVLERAVRWLKTGK
jgi:C-terminal processing protease CtpA/Prc